MTDNGIPVEDILRTERFLETHFGRIHLREDSIDLLLRDPLSDEREKAIVRLWRAWAVPIYFRRRNMRMAASLTMPHDDCRCPPEDFRHPRMPHCHPDLPCPFFDLRRQRCRFRYPYAPLTETPFMDGEPSVLAVLEQWGGAPRREGEKLSLYKDEKWISAWVKEKFPSVAEKKRTKSQGIEQNDKQYSLFDIPDETYDERKKKAFSLPLSKRDAIQHMIIFDEGGYDWMWKFMDEEISCLDFFPSLT